MSPFTIKPLRCLFLALLLIYPVVTAFPDVPTISSGSAFLVNAANDDDGFKVFRTWCSEPGPATCSTFSMLPYNRTYAADLSDQDTDDYLASTFAFATRRPEAVRGQSSWMLFQQNSLPTILPYYGNTPREFTLSFMFRQHVENAVENNRTRFPIASLSAYVVDNVDISGVDVMAPYIDRQNVIYPISSETPSPLRFTSRTSQWTKYSGRFSVKEFCTQCRIALLVELDSWASYWGVQWYIANVTFTETPTELSLAPEVHVSEHTVVRIPVIPPFSSVPRENCPHEQAALKSWGAPQTWGAAVPTFGQNVTLPENSLVLLRASDLGGELFSFYSANPSTDSTTLPTPTMVHGHFSLITIPETSSLIIDDSALVLGLRGIIVRGSLVLGSPSCRLTNKVQLVFSSPYAHDSELGILVRGGRLEMHGQVSNPPWVRLSRTVMSSNTIVYLQESVNSGAAGNAAGGWKVGAQVVVTGTNWRALQREESEVRTIKSVREDGRAIELDFPLRHVHYAGKEFQGEVGLLSRSIELYGGRSFAAAYQDGAHVMISQKGVGRISGVAAARMGQTNQLGRYPFHFHMLESSPDSYIVDSAVVESYYRCVVVHGTNNMTVSRNVAFRSRGHCYYLEDGVEESNTFEFNLGSDIYTIHAAAAGIGQMGEWFEESDELRNPADTSAGAFYITNAYNTFRGNVAVGGWTGFAFPNLPRPINLHRQQDFSDTLRNPRNRNILLFDGNTARSTASVWYESGGVYVGGLLMHQANGLLLYNSGRQSRDTYDNDGNTAWMQFTNTLCAHTFRGIAHWGNQVEVRHFENHESVRGLVLFGEALIYHALITGRTEHSKLVDLEMPAREGFQYYDTWVKTLLVNVTFANYDGALGDSVILGMTHSDTWKPQGINAARAISFVNCTRKSRFAINDVPTGSSWMYNVIDYDGSTVDKSEAQIVGSHQPWWNYDDMCAQDPDWGLWICPKGQYDIASMEIFMPGITRTDEETGLIESHRQIGYMSLLQRGPKRTRLPLTKNPTTTGVSDTIWYMELFGGSPRTFDIDTIQIPYNHFVVLAIPYSSAANFTVTILQKWWDGPRTIVVPQAESLEDIVAAEVLWPKSQFICQDPWNPPGSTFDDFVCKTGGKGPLWYFNGTVLFVRLVDMLNYIPITKPYGDFNYAREGAVLNTIENAFRWTIQADCLETCAGSDRCHFSNVENLEETSIDIPKPIARCRGSTVSPSVSPSASPTYSPSRRPTRSPTARSNRPSRRPTRRPSVSSSKKPSMAPTMASIRPTRSPVARTAKPTRRQKNRPHDH